MPSKPSSARAEWPRSIARATPCSTAPSPSRCSREPATASPPGGSSARMVGSGRIVGRPGYMAPEQIEGRPADARSDVFSLGVVIFEMLTGTSAFAGATTWERMDATVRRELPDVHAVRPETPAALARIVTRSVSKRPEDRYASGHEVRDELFALRASLDGSSRASARQLRLG